MSKSPVEGPLKAAHARVTEYVEHSLTRNPTTKFLFEKLTEAGALRMFAGLSCSCFTRNESKY